MNRTRFAVFLLALLCACSATTSPARGPTWGFAMRDVKFPLRDFRFPSGLRVLVEEDHRMPLVAVTTVVGAGSTSDPAGKEGLAHYVEHLTFRARPDGKTSMESLLVRAGAGAHNASTMFDRTVYYSLAPREALSGLLVIEGQRLLAPLDGVAPAAAALEREVIRNELRVRGETGYIGAVFSAMQRAVFPESHPYHRPVIGTHASLSSITDDDARAFAKAHYRPDNATLVIVGDVSLADVAAVVESSLPAALKAGAGVKPPVSRLPPESPAPPAPTSEKLGREQANVPTPELWVGWSLPRGFDADSVLLEAVTRSARSALSHAFALDQDISGVTIRREEGKEASLLLCEVTLRSGAHPETSLDHVLNQLVQLWQLPPSEADADRRGELPLAGRRAPLGRPSLAPSGEVEALEASFSLFRRTVVTSMLTDSESLVTRGEQRALAAHFTGDPLVYSRKLKAAIELPASAVADFANKHLTRERARAVLFTPGADPADSSKGAPADPDPEPLPLAPDAETMRAFSRPLGVSSYSETTLPNGLDVIVGQRAGLPVATVKIAFRTGVSEAFGADRLAALLAEPVVTSKVQPAQFGARFSMSGDSDDRRYSMSGSSGNVADMIALLGEWTSGMKVYDESARFFQREMVPAVRAGEGWPEAQGRRTFWSLVYPGHVYGKTPLADDLAKLDAGAANGWLHATHTGRNGTVVIVGEIDDVAAVQGAVEAAFGGLPAGAPRAAPAAPSIAQGAAAKPRFVMVPRPGATQLEISFGCALPPPQGSMAAHDVAAALLGARLHDQLRRRLGATYGFAAQAVALRGGATHLQASSAVDNAHAKEAMALLRDALHDFSSPAGAADLDRARWARTIDYAVSFPSVSSIASEILNAKVLELPLASVDRYPADVLATSPAAVTALFRACAAAPVLVAVGDASVGEPAFAAAWP